MKAKIEQLANNLHAAWAAEYRRQNGANAQRWKPVTGLDLEFVLAAQAAGSIEAAAVRSTDACGVEIDIAGLGNSQLPSKFSAENTAAAAGAINAISVSPEGGMEEWAAVVHDQWLERNGAWAPAEQKLPYSDLSEGEKEKDRAVVRAALEVLN